jgi:hypothetical protein
MRTYDGVRLSAVEPFQDQGLSPLLADSIVAIAVSSERNGPDV